MTEDRKNSSRHVYSFPSQVLSWRFVLVFARERHPCSPPKTQVPPVDVKYISNPRTIFSRFSPIPRKHPPIPRAERESIARFCSFPSRGENFPIFSPSAAEGVREGKEGMAGQAFDDCHVEGDGEAGEKNSASRERGEGGFFEAPGHPCRGEKESSSLSSSRFPFRFPSYSRKISWRRRSSWEVMPQVLRKAWIRWSRGSPGAPYSRNASRRR